MPDISEADFVVLGHPSLRNFEEWLRQSNFYGKVPLKPQWVFDCVEQEELLDVEDYAYEGLGRVEKKRGRPSSTGQRYILTAVKSGSESESEESEDDDDEEQERRKKRKVEKPVKKEKVKAEKQKVKPEKKEKKERKEEVKEEKGAKKKANSNGKAKTPAKDKGKGAAKVTGKIQQPVWRGPPSPPPPTIVVEHTRNKNLYTKEDLDYFDEYIPILLARDHTMSNTTIAERLHAKVRYSVKSIGNQVTESS